MIYIEKTILCSGLLLLAYFLFPARGKTFGFNRVYLLVSLVFSLAIPFVTMEEPVEGRRASVLLPMVEIQDAGMRAMDQAPKSSGPDWVALLPFIYWPVVLFLSARFFKNLMALTQKVRKGTVMEFADASMVITAEVAPVHSFLRYIFIPQGRGEAGFPEGEVLTHELAHVRQRHSWDVLFMEIVLVFCWFNPFLYLYRRAIRLNHEFLADRATLRQYPDIAAYQHLLLSKMGPASSPLSSRLNYSMTKKRFIMMSKRSASAVALLRQLAVIPFAAAAIFLFATHMAAQAPMPAVVSRQAAGDQDAVAEYRAIVERYKAAGPHWKQLMIKHIAPADRQRLEELFGKMGKADREGQEVFFMPPLPPLGKIVPLPAELKAWAYSGDYGIWVDDKKIENSQLLRYKASDFAQVSISRLTHTAIHYGEYTYQLNLMTGEYYERYYSGTISDHQPLMVFRRSKIR